MSEQKQAQLKLFLIALLEAFAKKKRKPKTLYDITLQSVKEVIAEANIAKKTRAMYNSIRFELERQVISQKGQPTILISLSPTVISGLDRKAKWHTRQHPSFNPAFAAGYKKPTVPGSIPIDTDRIIRDIRIRVISKLPKK